MPKSKSNLDKETLDFIKEQGPEKIADMQKLLVLRVRYKLALQQPTFFGLRKQAKENLNDHVDYVSKKYGMGFEKTPK